jgi:hypothetical protein
MGKIEAKVVTLPNEQGRELITPFLSRIGTSHHEKIKAAFAIAAIRYMSLVNASSLPTSEDPPLSAELEIEVDGILYTREFKLVKPLQVDPVYELRVNLPQQNWRLRITFFPFEYKGVLFYCFVHPFLKVPGDEDRTNFYRDRTAGTYYYVSEDPGLFLDQYLV